jgi:hypothetical protein
MGPLAGGGKVSLPMMRYSCLQEDSNQLRHPSQHVARAVHEPSHVPRDGSERHFRDVSEWTVSPESLVTAGKTAGVSVRKGPQRATGGGAAVIRSAKDRDSGNVPDLPPRFAGGNGRSVAGPSAAAAPMGKAGKVTASNFDFQIDGGASLGFAQHAGGKMGRPPMLQVMQGRLLCCGGSAVLCR